MPERVTVPAFDRNGRQLAAGEAPRFKLAEVTTNGPVDSAGAPLEPAPALFARPCSRCGRRFRQTIKRRLLCANCFQERLGMGGVSDMSAKTDPPAQEEVVTVRVEMDAATRQALAELVAPCTLWARSTGAPDPSLGDIVGLAIQVLHGQVADGAASLLATGEVGPRPTAH